MKKILSLHLKNLAKLIINKYQPVIIGITGSIGKSSAKEAIYAVLKNKLAVRMSQKNYNNEIGLPLTIIGAESAGRSLFGWAKIYIQAINLIVFKNKKYPQVLVLEMGVDHPGDMSYLTSIVKPMIGLVTAVSYSHFEFFGSVYNIKKEKQVLIENLDSRGLAILNYDNELTREMSDVSRARILTYGLKEGADLRAQDVIFNFTRGNYELSGLNCKLNYKGSVVPVFMNNIMTEGALYAALAAAAVGIYFEMNLVDIAQALQDFSLPHGRMNVLPGINHTFIIDDTYNSSPEACLAALDIISRFTLDNGSVKYAVLGDMLELGDYAAEGHQQVGEKVAASRIDFLLTFGPLSEIISKAAISAGLKDNQVFHFLNHSELSDFLKSRIKAGDIVLVKGSQGMRLEKVVKEIIAEPERAAELLVRQGEQWQ